MMSAQHAETTTELQENVLTVPVISMNFTTDFVFQKPDVELDNGLIMMEFVMKSITDATLSTHQLVIVQAVFKDITSLTESVVLEDNSIKMENVLMPLMLLKLSTMMDAADLLMVLDVLFVMMASTEFKINSDSFSVKPIDCFYIYF